MLTSYSSRIVGYRRRMKLKSALVAEVLKNEECKQISFTEDYGD
jgi:hypothetical protein